MASMKKTKDYYDQSGQDPYEKFLKWQELCNQTSIKDPTAAFLATVSEDGWPHGRIILVKEISKGSGAIFYTNYQSTKGHDLSHNSKAALCFYWDQIGRQVRIEGITSKLSSLDSEKYFKERPLEAQISATLSKQSAPLKSYEEYEKFLEDTKAKEKELLITPKGESPLPCPNYWGGYSLKIEKFEFWQDRPHRRHLRELYTLDKVSGNFSFTLLYP